MTAEGTGASIAATPAPATGRAGRNLPAAIGVGAALGALVVVTLWLSRPLFLAVMAAAISLALWETARALAARGIATPLPVLVLGTLGMLSGAYYDGSRMLLVAFAASVLAVLLWRLPGGSAGFLRDVTASVFCLVYLPALASFAALLLQTANGFHRVLTFVLVTVAADIGGYAVGATVGRHPLAPTISPKKSWEGFAGATVACLLTGVATVVLLLDGPWWVGLLLGALAVVTATLGDLVESLIKRDLGIKDMSTVLPGHGGLMDRLDSLLMTAPVAWAIIALLLPKV